MFLPNGHGPAWAEEGAGRDNQDTPAAEGAPTISATHAQTVSSAGRRCLESAPARLEQVKRMAAGPTAAPLLFCAPG